MSKDENVQSLLSVVHLVESPERKPRKLYSYPSISNCQVNLYIDPNNCVIIDGQEIVDFFKLKKNSEIKMTTLDLLKAVQVSSSNKEENSLLYAKIYSPHNYPNLTVYDEILIKISSGIEIIVLEKKDFSLSQYNEKLDLAVKEFLINILCELYDMSKVDFQKITSISECFTNSWGKNNLIALDVVDSFVGKNSFQNERDIFVLKLIKEKLFLFLSMKRVDFLIDLLKEIYREKS